MLRVRGSGQRHGTQELLFNPIYPMRAQHCCMPGAKPLQPGSCQGEPPSPPIAALPPRAAIWMGMQPLTLGAMPSFPIFQHTWVQWSSRALCPLFQEWK